MNKLPQTREEMAAMLDSAIASNPIHPEPANLEHLAMLSTGRGDDLSPGDREKLLRQISADPTLAQLVAELTRPGSKKQATAPTKKPAAKKPKRDSSEPAIYGVINRTNQFQYWLYRAWAVAAMLMLCFGTWKYLAGSSSSVDNISIGTLSVHEAHKGFTMSSLDTIRDTLFLISMLISTLLTLVVAFVELRGRNRG